MMEETVMEIPERTKGEEWQPPVLKRQRTDSQQSMADVFFVQYAVCILLLTVLFVIRLCDEEMFRTILVQFRTRTHAGTEEWILQLAEFLHQLWS